jgi:hypothetical protein
MTVEELLRDLEGLNHGGRVRAIVALGQRDDTESRALIADLERGGFYERSLALYTCFGSRDGEHALRALSDPSRLLRGLATQLVALFCDSAQALRGLETAPPAARIALAHKLRRGRRQAVIDTYLGGATLEEAALRALLPFASVEMSQRLMTRFALGATNDTWRRMARLLPTPTFAELERQVATATENDGRLIARINTTLPLLTSADPDRALTLVTALLRVTKLDSITLEPLVARRPIETANLLLSQPRPEGQQRSRYAWRRQSGGLTSSFRQHLRQLTAEQIIGLYRLNQQMFGWGEWFALIAPDVRLAVYSALRQQLRYGDHLPAETIAALPVNERVSEARISLAQPGLTANVRMSYAAYLPWTEARAMIDPHLRASDTITRQAALAALVRAVTYNRDHLGDALVELRERRNEQDPVRNAMFTALGALPPSVWKAENLHDLEEIIRHGLNDVGLSNHTLNVLVDLLLKLAPAHPDWASAQLEQALRERGWPSSAGGASNFSPAVELQIARTLVPLLSVWMKRGSMTATQGAIERFYIRRAAFALVADLVEEFVRQARGQGEAERMLRLLSARAHNRFAALVSALLAEDASWYTLPLIADYLARRRQDLLTPFLAYQSYDGRWNTGRQRALPQLDRPLAGATASQQQRLADVALATIADPEQDSAVTNTAIRLLALLPAVPAERVTPLASDSRPLVRTTALFTLARLDTDGGQDALLAALDDARARIAIHALHRFLVAMPTERALAILRAVPLDRVTVAKEVMRLTADLAPDAAFAELLALERRDLHRDVRIALLRSLNPYLDRAQTWEILERAARGPDAEVAQATLTLTTLASAHNLATQESAATQSGALRLVGALITRPEVEARAQALQYCARLGMNDSAHGVTPALLALVEAGIAPGHTRTAYDEGMLALNALFGVCAPSDRDRVSQLFVTLLPHRRLLQAAVDALISAPRLRERGLEPIVREAASALASDPLTVRLRMRLVTSQLAVEDITPFFTELATQGTLEADDLAWACEQFERGALSLSLEALASMEDAWRARDDARLRRLALAILRARAQRTGEWTEELMARLRAYRGDGSPLVAAAAQFTFPRGDAPEDEEPGA